MNAPSAFLRSACVFLTALTFAHGADAQFPIAPGREVTQKVCGSCHGAEVTVSKAKSRQQWGEVITSMVAKGAKATSDEFAQILDYLATNFPPQNTAAATPGRPARPPSAGPMDVHIVDTAGADRGKTIYIAECITCHGQRARGKDDAADLVRSVVVLHDRYGNTVGPFLAKGHPMQSGHPSASLTTLEVSELSHFLHQRVADTLRSGPYSKVLNVLTGDPKAGASYFSGAGGCASCHSPARDLSGVGSKYDPPTLQQRFLFPRAVSFGRGGGIAQSKPVTVKVTLPSGDAVSGVLNKIDDFNVSLRDSDGQYRSYARTPEMKIEKQDPYSAHDELLEKYSDKNIHDVVAYLATLK